MTTMKRSENSMQNVMLDDQIGQSITDMDGVFIVRTDSCGKITYSNSAYAKTFFSNGHGIGASRLTQVFQEDHYKLSDAVIRCLEKVGNRITVTIRQNSVCGKLMWIRWECVALINERTNSTEMQSVGLDITDVKEITTHYKVNEEVKRLSILAEQTINGVVITDLEGRIQWVNDGYTRITGYSLNELLGKKPGAILQGKGTDSNTAQALRENILNKKACDVEILNYSKEGIPYWVRIQLQPYYDDFGAVTGFFALETDVTEKRNHEREIRERKQLLEKIADLSPVVISLYDLRKKQTVYSSRSLLHLLGFSEQERIDIVDKVQNNQNYGICPEDVATLDTFLMKCRNLADGDHEITEYRVLNSQNNWEWINRRTAIFERDENGEPTMYINAFLFVTDKKRAEEEMNEAYNRLIQAKKMAKLGTWKYDLQTKRINVSPHLLLLFGTLSESNREMDKEDFLTIYVHPDDRQQLRDAWFVPHTNENGFDYTEHIEFRGLNQSDDEEYHYYSVSQNAFSNNIIGTVQDITDRVKMERDLRVLNDRLEERVIERTTELLRVSQIKESVMDIVTHDVKNMLGGVLLQGEILTKHADSLDIEKIQQYSQAIVGRVQDINMVLKDMLELRKLEEGVFNPHMEQENLKEMILNIGEKNRFRAMVKDIDIVYTLLDVEIVTDGILLTEIVENILSNALKFSPFGSVVTLSLSFSASHAIISVSDKGPGLTDDDKKNLFKRFAKLSNAPTGGESSTGLGLAITKQLVELLGGEVYCESELGKGTTFTVRLPKDPVVYNTN